jgi:hypothetical protein
MSDVGQHNDASDMEDFQDDVVEMEPRSRYDEREDKKKQEKHGLIIDQVNTFFDAILHHPELWAKPELKKTREFGEIVSHDPVHFPPTLPLSSLHNEEATQSVPELTKGFAKSVYDGAIRDDHDLQLSSLRRWKQSTIMFNLDPFRIKKSNTLSMWQIRMIIF